MAEAAAISRVQEKSGYLILARLSSLLERSVRCTWQREENGLVWALLL